MKPARWAVALRALLLAGTVLGCVLAVRELRRAPAEASSLAYTCPMHPHLGAAGPGDCPICGMALVTRNAAASAGVAASTLPPGSVDLPRRRVVTHQPTVPARVLPDWSLLAIVYDDDLAVLAPDERGRFRPSTGAAAPVEVVRTAAPPLAWDDSTHRVGFRPAARSTLVPGTVGWVELPERSREALVLPASAVVLGADGPAVLAVGGEGEPYRRLQVSVGRSPYGQAMVLSGLRPTERVLVKGAFFVDASERLAGPAPAER